MRIAIDISQVVYEGTGVGKYVRNLTDALISREPDWEFVLFAGVLRRKAVVSEFVRLLKERHPHARIRLVIVPLPPKILDFLWNRLHLVPAEWLVGDVDLFWSSDWTQPPVAHALSVTTVHDVSVFRFPLSFPAAILAVQKRRLKRVAAGCDLVFCDSEATRLDIAELLTIPEKKLYTIYPGFTTNL